MCCLPTDAIFLSSSMAEHSAVNRRVVGSSPTSGAIFIRTKRFAETSSKAGFLCCVPFVSSGS